MLPTSSTDNNIWKYSHPPLNDTVKSLNSIFNFKQHVFPVKTVLISTVTLC